MLIKHLTYRSLSTIQRKLTYVFREEAKEDIVKDKLDYVFREDAYGTDQVVYTHNLRGDTIEEYAEQFKALYDNRKIKRKDSVALVETILSFSEYDTDELTPEKITDIVKKFIELRSDRTAYCAVSHLNTNHRHVHVLYSNYELVTGKSIRMDNTRFKQLKVDLEGYQLEQYPELEHSVIGFGERPITVSEHMQEVTQDIEEQLMESFEVIREAGIQQFLNLDR